MNLPPRVLTLLTNFSLSLSDPNIFHTQCGYIFQRMIDTVPAAVTLSDPIVAQKWKIMTYNYELAADGTLSILGRVRVRNTLSLSFLKIVNKFQYLCGIGLTCPAPPTLSYIFDTSNGPTGSFSTLPLGTTAGTTPGSWSYSNYSSSPLSHSICMLTYPCRPQHLPFNILYNRPLFRQLLNLLLLQQHHFLHHRHKYPKRILLPTLPLYLRGKVKLKHCPNNIHHQ